MEQARHSIPIAVTVVRCKGALRCPFVVGPTSLRQLSLTADLPVQECCSVEFAISGLIHRSKKWNLFDQVINDREQIGRHRETVHLGCLEIDDHLNLGGSLDRRKQVLKGATVCAAPRLIHRARQPPTTAAGSCNPTPCVTAYHACNGLAHHLGQIKETLIACRSAARAKP
jgi:hypothetical protein